MVSNVRKAHKLTTGIPPTTVTAIILTSRAKPQMLQHPEKHLVFILILSVINNRRKRQTITQLVLVAIISTLLAGKVIHKMVKRQLYLQLSLTILKPKVLKSSPNLRL